MTISLALILLEATGNLSLLLPLSLSLFLSRWVGNVFNESLYHMHIHLQEIPFLEPQCPKEARVHDLRVCEIMATDPQFLRPVSNVGRIYELLLATGHHCFPLLEEGHTVFGSISRDTLCTLLFLKAFSDAAEGEQGEEGPARSSVLPYEKLERFFPHFPEVDAICLTKEERMQWIDLRPYCDTAPFFVSEATTVPRAYRLFRSLGLRHLLVVTKKGELVGVVTRHDLEEEHVMASLSHSPLLLSREVWKLDKACFDSDGGVAAAAAARDDAFDPQLSPAASPSLP